MITKTLLRGSILASALVLGSTIALAPAANAQDATVTTAAPAQADQNYVAHLMELNHSGASGEAHVTVHGKTIDVSFLVRGTSAALPHTVHIHSRGTHECPTIADDTNGDGLVTTTEGAPVYGQIVVSLTTSGDTSASSGLAVARFAPADANGVINYSRSIDLPVGVDTNDIANGVIVLHGISSLSGDPLAYDGPLMSDLDPTLPEEATIPSVCGPLEPVVAVPTASDLVNNVTTAGNTFDTKLNAALANVSDASAVAQFRASYDAAVKTHLDTLTMATMNYDEAVNGGHDASVARNEVINAFDASKAQAFNAFNQAKDRFSDELNQVSGSSAQRETFNNGFNAALDTLGNQLEVAKNQFSNSAH